MAYIGRRVLLVIPTLFAVLLGVFLMLHVAPGDPVEALFDVQMANIPPAEVERVRQQFGLHRPLHEQFLHYVGGLLRGDFGVSFRTRLPVRDDIVSHLPPTVILALAGITVAVLIGLSAGVISALKRNTATDYATLTLAMIGLSAPSFWLGILLLYVLSFRLQWFPLIGEGDGSLTSTVHHLVLPGLVIGMGLGALIARLTRSAVLETLGQDYVRTARAKGLRDSTVVLKHVLRNAAIPLVAAAGTMFAYLLTGAVVVEIVFSRRGLGSLMVGAIGHRDYPLAQGLILAFGVIIVLVNLLADLLMGLLDPRVSYQ